MALLDVSDVLEDPDFNDVFYRLIREQTVDEHGEASNTEQKKRCIGVITSDSGDKITRKPDGSFVTGTITIHTKTQLKDGKDGFDADVVEWKKNRYNVILVNDYSHVGKGFVAATCEVIPFSGVSK